MGGVPTALVQLIPVDDNRLVQIAILIDIDDVHGVVIDHPGAMAPRPMAVINFVGPQRHPAHRFVAVDPPYPARIPAKTDENAGRVGVPADHRRHPVPGVKSLDIHPGTVVVGDVAKGLVGNPAVVAVVLGPAADGKGTPAGINADGPPHVAIRALILHPLPTTVVFKNIGFLADRFGQQIRHPAAGLLPFGPHGVAMRVPVVPVPVHGAVALGRALLVGDNRFAAFAHREPGTGGVVDKINRAAHRDHFHRFIAHIQIKR